MHSLATTKSDTRRIVCNTVPTEAPLCVFKNTSVTAGDLLRMDARIATNPPLIPRATNHELADLLSQTADLIAHPSRS